MGKFRSKTGCLTCRARRVKCDEERPTCGQCGKKNRACHYEVAGVSIRQYQPPEETGAQSSTTAASDGAGDVEQSEHDFSPASILSGPSSFQLSAPSPILSRVPDNVSNPSRDSAPLPQSPLTSNYSSVTGQPQVLSRQDASLVHYFTERLGRWLDASDAARQFTLSIPGLVKKSPILLQAVLAFAAKHREDIPKAEQAHQRCVSLLVDRLQASDAVHDDALISTAVILRSVEQLNVSPSGSGVVEHLSGSSAILQASQEQSIDPSASTLRLAAFWIYVRQTLYSATINQHPPELDINMRLLPVAEALPNDHPTLRLSRETAWTNTIIWICACIVQFSFDGGQGTASYHPSWRQQKWRELWDSVQRWHAARGPEFDPIWCDPTGASAVFPEAWFAADWHTLAYCFYHFACLLLIMYKPAPRFATRNIGGKFREEDHQILRHARAMCGACVCSPENVACTQALCHSVFIWGPLMLEPIERNAVLDILTKLEQTHSWPTTWIQNALKNEWNMA